MCMQKFHSLKTNEVVTAKDSTPYKRFIGDVVHGLVIVNTLVYIGFMAAEANGMYNSIF